jgi:hypothetical protein
MAVSVYNFFVSTVGQDGGKGMKIRRFLQKSGDVEAARVEFGFAVRCEEWLRLSASARLSVWATPSDPREGRSPKNRIS